MWFEDDSLRAIYTLGVYEEQLRQIRRLVFEPGNENMIYTSELCQILGVEPPKKRETETEKNSGNDLPL